MTEDNGEAMGAKEAAALIEVMAEEFLAITKDLNGAISSHALTAILHVSNFYYHNVESYEKLS